MVSGEANMVVHVSLLCNAILLCTSCRQCVQVSSVCGWCVYNHTCTGTNSRCQAPQHWITLMDTEEVITVE